MYIVIWFQQTNILVYTCIYISLITMTNKSAMTIISVNKISVCLSVCLVARHNFKWAKIKSDLI